MKKILAIAAVAALTAGVSAYAANPFSDVSTSDWAYQAVSDLSDQGIVEGYPDGTFKGQQNMTRYELAQIIARLMAKEDQLNAEQKATVDKLAAQYADELANLGVRVANVEKKLGNVSFTGTAQFTFKRDVGDVEVKDVTDKQKPNEKKYEVSTKLADSYKGSMKLNAKAKVNDQVTVIGRLKASLNFQSAEDATAVEMDKLHVVYTPTENFSLDAGRTGVTFGNGSWYDSNFTGLIGNVDFNAVKLQAGYGRFTDNEAIAVPAWFAQVNTTIAEAVDLGAFYVQTDKKYKATVDQQKRNFSIAEDKEGKVISFWGVSAGVTPFDGFKVSADYVRNTTDLGKDVKTPVFWSAGAVYGGVDTDKVGSFELAARYYNADPASYVGGTGACMDSYLSVVGAKFWEVSADVAVMKGMDLKAYYVFNVKPNLKNLPVGDSVTTKLDNIFGVELNYAF